MQTGISWPNAGGGLGQDYLCAWSASNYGMTMRHEIRKEGSSDWRGVRLGAPSDNPRIGGMRSVVHQEAQVQTKVARVDRLCQSGFRLSKNNLGAVLLQMQNTSVEHGTSRHRSETSPNAVCNDSAIIAVSRELRLPSNIQQE